MEYTQINGNVYYGTNKGVLNNIIARGKICILEIDVKGAQKIHEQYKDANFLFINVKNFETLKERIIKRYKFLVNKVKNLELGALKHLNN